METSKRPDALTSLCLTMFVVGALSLQVAYKQRLMSDSWRNLFDIAPTYFLMTATTSDLTKIAPSTELNFDEGFEWFSNRREFEPKGPLLDKLLELPTFGDNDARKIGFEGQVAMPDGSTLSFETLPCVEGKCADFVSDLKTEYLEQLDLGEEDFKFSPFKVNDRLVVFADGAPQKVGESGWIYKGRVAFFEPDDEPSDERILKAEILRIGHEVGVYENSPKDVFREVEKRRSGDAVQLPVVGIQVPAGYAVAALFAIASAILLVVSIDLRAAEL